MGVSMRMLAAAIGAAALMVGTASAGMAATVYDYTGQGFAVAIFPYTTSDRISGSLTLSNPLAGNLNSQVVTPTAFSFSDGVQTFDQTNSTPVFIFSTDASGNVTQWDVIVPGGAGTLQTADFSGIVFDRANNGPFGNAMNSSSPGSWTSPSLSATPLPPAVWFFATGLGLLAWFGSFGRRTARRDGMVAIGG
jgi:hypothetical protein